MKKSGLKYRAIQSSLVSVVFVSLTVELSGQSVMQEELGRRRDSIIAAEEAIMEGDKAYQSSDYQGAVAKYRQAFAAIPAGAKTNKFKDAAKERYAQAAVEAARVMNRQGERDAAIALVDEVLGENVYPDYFPAVKLKGQLDDPIRTNASATKEHAQKIDEVRRLLYQAEGFYNLADYDKSIATYQKVLQVDSYNKAARRGMERVNAKISDYANAARDHTRAELMQQVASHWELKENEVNIVLDNGIVGEKFLIKEKALISDKLDNIEVPFVDFDETTLQDAIEFLQGRSRSLDPEIVEEKKGLDFVLNMGNGNSPEVEEILKSTFSLRLRNVPLRQVLEFVTSQTGTTFRVDRFAVVIQPAGGVTNDLSVRRYSVPPNFLSQSSSSSGGAGSDPFGDDETSSSLAPRLTAKEYLSQQGIPFPDGASASYNPGISQLTVKTTSIGHDNLQQLVESENMKEPVAIVIETKILSVSEENLEELGFDYALQNLAVSGDFAFSGGTVGNGRQTDFIGGEPVTAGLRSGDFATNREPIVNLLDRDNSGVPVTVSGLGGNGVTLPDNAQPPINSAPGILSVIGEVNDTGFSALLRGLNQKKGVDIMSQPSVITRSGQQATIEAVREFIYPTEYEPPELPNSIGSANVVATPAHPTAFETRKVGTILEVQPTISADRTYADLSFNLNVDDFLGFVNYGTPILSGNVSVVNGVTPGSGELSSNSILMPIFSSARLNTNITVASGSTIVVGGMVSERVENVEDKVPLLGDLPLVGKFFSSDALRREKRMVMVFVTVRIVDPAGNPVQN